MPTMNRVDMLNCAAGHHDFSDDASECHVCGLPDLDASMPAPTAAPINSEVLDFIKMMANFTTPDDEFAELKAEDGDDCAYEDADELMADFGEERLYGEYQAFMDMVRAARELRAKIEGRTT